MAAPFALMHRGNIAQVHSLIYAARVRRRIALAQAQKSPRAALRRCRTCSYAAHDCSYPRLSTTISLIDGNWCPCGLPKMGSFRQFAEPFHHLLLEFSVNTTATTPTKFKPYHAPDHRAGAPVGMAARPSCRKPCRWSRTCCRFAPTNMCSITLIDWNKHAGRSDLPPDVSAPRHAAARANTSTCASWCWSSRTTPPSHAWCTRSACA